MQVVKGSTKNIHILVATITARWASTSYKKGYNPFKWPYKLVTGVINLLIGVITPFITSRGPPCRKGNHLNYPHVWGYIADQKGSSTPPAPAVKSNGSQPHLCGVDEHGEQLPDPWIFFYGKKSGRTPSSGFLIPMMDPWKIVYLPTHKVPAVS